jgi:hypothetical protein
VFDVVRVLVEIEGGGVVEKNELRFTGSGLYKEYIFGLFA